MTTGRPAGQNARSISPSAVAVGAGIRSASSTTSANGTW
jgi:hypothetical protein